MEAREKGICFGSSDFFNEAFGACQVCSRREACYEAIYSMNLETIEPEVKPEPTMEPGALDYEKIAPKLRKASVDFRPIIDAIVVEKPKTRKDTAAIVKRFGVKASSSYGYARMILWNLGTEGFLSGFDYDDVKSEAVWIE